MLLNYVWFVFLFAFCSLFVCLELCDVLLKQWRSMGSFCNYCTCFITFHLFSSHELLIFCCLSLFHRFISLLLHCSIILSFYHSIIPSFFCFVTTSFYCFFTPFCYFIMLLLHDFGIILMFCCLLCLSLS
jgi:hypothetical protein